MMSATYHPPFPRTKEADVVFLMVDNGELLRSWPTFDDIVVSASYLFRDIWPRTTGEIASRGLGTATGHF